MKLAANIILFQATWFACVLGGANGLVWAGPVVALVCVSIYVWFERAAVPALLIVVLSGVLGAAFEAIAISTGALSYAGALGTETGPVPPAWLIAMWVGFGTLPRFALSFLDGRLLIAALLGAAAGPVAYWGGERLGGVTFPMGLELGLATAALMWAVALPILMMLTRQLFAGRQLPASRGASGGRTR